MANYRLQVYRRYPEKEMRQVVVYLRKTGSPRVFQKKFELTRTRHEFDVIRIWEEPAERFLETPGLLPFAVLARTSDREATLRRVSGQIEAIGDRGQRSDLAVSTAVLAGLVLGRLDDLWFGDLLEVQDFRIARSGGNNSLHQRHCINVNKGADRGRGRRGQRIPRPATTTGSFAKR